MKLKVKKEYRDYQNATIFDKAITNIQDRLGRLQQSVVSSRERKSDGYIYLEDTKKLYSNYFWGIRNFTFRYFEISDDETFHDQWIALNRLATKMTKKEYLKLVEAVCDSYKDLEWEI